MEKVYFVGLSVPPPDDPFPPCDVVGVTDPSTDPELGEVILGEALLVESVETGGLNLSVMLSRYNRDDIIQGIKIF